MASGGDGSGAQAHWGRGHVPDALIATHAGVWVAREGGPPSGVSRREAIARAGDTPHLMINAPVTASRLGYPELSGLDLLELFAFVHPARFAVPTPRGLAEALGIDGPGGEADTAFLVRAARALLGTLVDPGWTARRGAHGVFAGLARHRWPWAGLVRPLLKAPETPERSLFTALPRWEEGAPREAPRPVTLDASAVQARLASIMGDRAEPRPGQRDYAAAVTQAFQPRTAPGRPQVVLAEAGTGIGKTLGYLAPAISWAEAAGGAVWLSTYTRALQRQLDAEAARVVPGMASLPATPAGAETRRVVVRKGRENYLCLLNLEDAVQGGFQNRAAHFAQLVARWAEYSRDGDMVGGDLPGWLPRLFGRTSFAGLTDRRGECIYAACPHYRTCFIEKATRASAQADLVIANHALVMINAVRGRTEGQSLSRIVFDEGHHLFDAADNAFSVALTGREAVELKNWLLGPPTAKTGRRRGLAARLADITSYDDAAADLVERIASAARALPSDAWLARAGGGEPEGPIETLLAAVRAQLLTHATARDVDAAYGLETEIADPLPALVDAGAAASAALTRMSGPMAALAAHLEAVLDDPPDWLDTSGRARVEGAANGLKLRCELLAAWGGLLARLGGPADPVFVDWLAIPRVDGRDYDIGLHRHWLDPMLPFARGVLAPAQGVLITSATLRGRGGDDNWEEADALTGARHLPAPARHFAVESPFDYAGRARVLIVTDVRKGDVSGLAQAFRALIEAAGGGTLGLFTAIARLRAVHARIADPLARAGLPLYAQHVDPIDTGTLVDIFRAEPKASLIGTDALRDGVDVPGESLRLVVMEGVPWARPTVLHSARRAAAPSAQGYDDRVVMGRLAQAFGRLIRRADDRGHFVLIGAAAPSRLQAAFPAGTPIDRVTLEEAVAIIAGLPQGAVPCHGADQNSIGDSRSEDMG